MRRRGFEPLQALSHCGLNAARLTTPASPLCLNTLVINTVVIKLTLWCSRSGYINYSWVNGVVVFD